MKNITKSGKLTLLLATLAALLPGLRAETLRLPGGEVLIGRVIERNATTIVFESKTLGRLSVPAAGVEVVPDGEATAPVTKTAAAAPSATPGGAPPPGGPGGPPPQSGLRKLWKLPEAFSAEIQLGIDKMDTDVKARNYTAEVTMGWKTPKYEYQTYSSYEKVEILGINATNTRVHSGRAIRHINERWMWLSQLDWRHDESQGIAWRVDAVSMPAYYFIKNDRFSLLGGAGPAYEWRRWAPSPVVPRPPMEEQFNVAGYQVFRWKILPALSFHQTFLGYVDPDDSSNHRTLVEANLRQRLPAGLSLMLHYEYRKESNPAPLAVETQKRFVTKIGYEF